MNYTGKRMLSIVLAAAMMAGTFSTDAFAAETGDVRKIGRASCRERG